MISNIAKKVYNVVNEAFDFNSQVASIDNDADFNNIKSAYIIDTFEQLNRQRYSKIKPRTFKYKIDENKIIHIIPANDDHPVYIENYEIELLHKFGLKGISTDNVGIEYYCKNNDNFYLNDITLHSNKKIKIVLYILDDKQANTITFTNISIKTPFLDISNYSKFTELDNLIFNNCRIDTDSLQFQRVNNLTINTECSFFCKYIMFRDMGTDFIENKINKLGIGDFSSIEKWNELSKQLYPSEKQYSKYVGAMPLNCTMNNVFKILGLTKKAFPNLIRILIPIYNVSNGMILYNNKKCSTNMFNRHYINYKYTCMLGNNWEGIYSADVTYELLNNY